MMNSNNQQQQGNISVNQSDLFAWLAQLQASGQYSITVKNVQNPSDYLKKLMAGNQLQGGD
jgi:hypothetical protein